jgi:hypothetical protein
MNKEELLIAITKELQLYNKVSLHTMGNISDLIDRYHQTEVKKLDKPVVMQGCQCKDRIGETTVWCCNQCGLPCEDGWLPTHKAIRQPTVASSAVGSQTSARTCANGCDWPNCTLEGCVDPKCDC